ncbi:hypothetical protein [Stutzerimonas stutzeri]|uniref:Uncharacterized protein n=1 Tax=Stutzerimonas stutzeri TaxID=316 RepID=A0A0D9APB0_STUST|nr:hypothetical protein [Stutzerimonas stutzeri]KJH82860.1 hypothetical protein UF78_08435 [Stutzerimonas stutzeri]
MSKNETPNENDTIYELLMVGGSELGSVPELTPEKLLSLILDLNKTDRHYATRLIMALHSTSR